MKRLLTVVFLMIHAVTVFSQADDLKKNAYAILNSQSVQINITAIDAYETHVTKDITILKQGAEALGYFMEFYDESSKISDVSIEIYDWRGKRVRKYKDREILDILLSPLIGSVTNVRMMKVETSNVSYPYTVKMEYHKKYKDLFDIPDWFLQEDLHVSVKRSRLELINESGELLLTKFQGIADSETQWLNETPGNEHFVVTIENQKAIDDDLYMMPVDMLTPQVKIALSKFSYDGYEGEMSSWQSIGLWFNALMDGRSELPGEAVAEVNALVEGMRSKKEKVQAVYEYMQERCRYVSIQLGIGGWQPFEASFVHEKGYGDCKALSFYTKSLLEGIGIASDYAAIKSGNGAMAIDTDFPSNQFNHVILCVPDTDTIWLECTDMHQPFNYLGSFTADRYALLIGETGGKLVRTPAYSSEQSTLINVGSFTVDENGSVCGQVSSQYGGMQYDLAENWLVQSEEDLKNEFLRSLDFSNCKLNKMDVKATKSDGRFPEITREVEMMVEGYGKKTGKRIFLQPNILNRNNNRLVKDDGRVSDIVISFPFYDVDSVTYKIPDNFKVERLPKEVWLQSEFGEYHQHVVFNAGVLTFALGLPTHKINWFFVINFCGMIK